MAKRSARHSANATPQERLRAGVCASTVFDEWSSDLAASGKPPVILSGVAAKDPLKRERRRDPTVSPEIGGILRPFRLRLCGFRLCQMAYAVTTRRDKAGLRMTVGLGRRSGGSRKPTRPHALMSRAGGDPASGIQHPGAGWRTHAPIRPGIPWQGGIDRAWHLLQFAPANCTRRIASPTFREARPRSRRRRSPAPAPLLP